VLAYVHRPIGLEAAGPDEFGPIKNPEEPRGLADVTPTATVPTVFQED
jgi:hypothetical protein